MFSDFRAGLHVHRCQTKPYNSRPNVKQHCAKKSTIHQVTTRVIISVRSSVPVVSSLAGGYDLEIGDVLELTSMVVPGGYCVFAQ